FRSWNISGPVPDALARISTIVLLAALAAAYAVTDQTARHPRSDAARDVAFGGHGALVVLLAAMGASKVLSPQYLVWLTPFVPFVIGPRPQAVLAAGVITGVVYTCAQP